MVLAGDEMLDAPIEWEHATTRPDIENADSLTVSEKTSDFVPVLDAGSDFAQLGAFSESITLVEAQVSSLATAAFDSYAAAMENAVATGHFSAAGIGKAMKASAKQSLISIGQQATVRGMFEVGYGIKAYANDDAEGGSKHMAAAGQFMAVAAVAGAGAGAMGGKGGGGGKNKKRDDEVAPSGANPSGQGSGGKVIQQITVIGNPTDAQVEETKSKFAGTGEKETRH